ncbi:hypothetical protein EJ04DRAFT_563615 [Polyplosphaeria fusca]|uniref:Uncharacterized protein n=1 Tax=Polyplosphaeria fusca TaxID=682080 RepID=A0A9P4QWR0_9PLEO|nr:hypothetical protein EJ04DRAFT_563615 [Polyplosphaeria fusca]
MSKIRPIQTRTRPISSNCDEPFSTIATWCNEAKAKKKQLQGLANEDSTDEEEAGTEVGPEVNCINMYLNYLHFQATKAFTERREAKIREALQTTYPSLNIFFTAAVKMLGLINKKSVRARTGWGASMTSIPQLREFLLELPSDNNLERYHRHCIIALEDTLVDKAKIALKKHEGDPAYTATRLGVKARISDIQITLQNAFDDLRADLLPKIWTDPAVKATRLEQVKKVIDLWARPLHWLTLRKTMCDNGILWKTNSKAVGEICPHGRRNLNWHMLSVFISDVDDWKLRVDAVKPTLRSSVDLIVKDVLESITTSLQDYNGEFELREQAIYEWNKKSRSIDRKLIGFSDSFGNAIHEAHVDITRETDRDSFVARMNKPVYCDALGVENGNGYRARQGNVVRKELVEPDKDGMTMLDRYEIRAVNHAEKMFEKAFESFVTTIIDSLDAFVATLDRLVEPDHAPHLDISARENLRALLPELESAVEDIKSRFPRHKNIRTDDPTKGEAPAEKKPCLGF